LINDIKNLQLSSFIPNEATILYSMNYKNQDIMIAVYRNPKENFILRLNNLINFTEQIDSISSILSYLNIVNLICDKYNDLDILKVYANAIMTSTLEDHVVKSLLTQNTSDFNAELEAIYIKNNMGR
jgi:hypothetical protein